MRHRIGRQSQRLVIAPKAAERIDLRIDCNRRVGNIGMVFRDFYRFIERSERLVVPSQLDQAISVNAGVSHAGSGIMQDFGGSPRLQHIFLRFVCIPKDERGDALFAGGAQRQLQMAAATGEFGDLRPGAPRGCRVIVGFQHSTDCEDSKAGFRVRGCG